MPDPFLDAHRLAPGLFICGYPLTPISIRDQIVRGTRLGHLVHVPAQAKVLVVGAGVAGICAAVILAQRGCDVLVAESAATPFSVQASADTRFLDPWQYDWPISTAALAPAVLGPLTYLADHGRNLHLRWTAELARWQALLGSRLTVSYGTAVTALGPATGHPRPQIPATLSSSARLRKFDLVILAVGSGTEKSSLQLTPPPGSSPASSPGFLTTPKFWDHDTVEDADLGLPSHGSVVVIGSGDGALQDFLRAATLPPATPGTRATAQHLFDSAFPPSSGIRLKTLDQVAAVDAQFQRAWTWSVPKSPQEVRAFVERHNALQTIATQAYGDSHVEARVDASWRTDFTDISLLFLQDYFTAFYTLNCFLVLLLAESAKSGAARAYFWSHTSVTSVACVGTNPGLPNFSAAGPYNLTVQQAGSSLMTSADYLVVRTGITPSPLHRSAPTRTRHLLPYF